MNRNRVKNNLVALGSAAVLTVYAAGYLRTRSAAQRFAVETAERSGPVSTADTVAPQADTAELKPSAPSALASSAVPKAARASRPVTDTTTLDTAKKAVDIPPAGDSSATARAVQAADSATKSTEKPEVHYNDGTYSGWGTSRHGDIQASVEIKEGRIISASITQCLTRYSCSWIEDLPGQVVARQSPETDYVSGATQSTNAFYYAIVQALSKAK